ncbi:hypothetical protein Skr01_05960 [Sphaerisporangium krabiense]|uniref:DUF402 domain-containing protein n=1 Tax=Sphaerisporangium krabiense TaxID=763782 RepID=A0A7W8Z7F4_9ACTN|nr:DUF402 domain-containing protein [Sphaerisporangium krabiense]MBB5628650.1 hypothetical protein [Sphaerisporangium krabiense]GII60511.1 hypothetical protein Skr01_05960 [Sphaerisporangium krabiense]
MPENLRTADTPDGAGHPADAPVRASASADGVTGVTGTAVKVVFTKYDGSLHWHHDAWRLGEDEHGVWLGCPPGTPTARGSEPPVVWEHAFVMLFPRDAWWTATFNSRAWKCAIYCDITTVPRWDGDRVTMADLDLDVLLMQDGRLFVDDEDEFLEHRVRYGYPEHVVAEARRSADRLMAAIDRRDPPFGGAHERWLAEVL